MYMYNIYSVEMKVVEGLFYYCHGSQIPSGFNYGNYVGYLYSQYLAEVSMIFSTCMYICICVLFDSIYICINILACICTCSMM